MNPATWFLWVLGMTTLPYTLLAAYRYAGRLYGGL